ncbi:MAG: hypothetical protein AB7V32_10515 [Candidatus Berkiella sp.]
MFDKAPLPKHIVMIIILVITSIMIGGYGLYYHSKREMAKKDREFELLKEKEMHATENYNDLKKKFDVASNDLAQINKDYEVLLQKHQECKSKQDELQTAKDQLTQTNEQLQKELNEAQVKLGISPTTPNTTGSDHPVKMLDNNKSNEKSAKPNENALQCPSPESVTSNAQLGSWKENHISWWMAFTSRPLLENESIKDLFKILYDGNSIACYYALNSNTDTNTWVVVKGDVKNKSYKLSEKGWSLCPTDECKSICEKENLKECSFSIE